MGFSYDLLLHGSLLKYCLLPWERRAVATGEGSKIKVWRKEKKRERKTIRERKRGRKRDNNDARPRSTPYT